MGDGAGGVQEYREVLDTSRRIGLLLGVAAGLDYVAEVAIWDGDPARAVRLGATAARLKQELGGGVPPRMGGALDPLVIGRDILSSDVFAREAAVGRAMDINSAVDDALKVEAPDSLDAAARQTDERAVQVLEVGDEPV